MTEIRIPDIGDAENVEVIELCVEPGETVDPDDAILVIESDKASMEVPAGIAGTLEELLVGIGDPVEEGQLIARLVAPDEGAADASGETVDVAASQPEIESEELRREPEPPSVSEAETGATEVAAPGEVVVSVPDIGDAQDVVVIEVAIGPGDEVDEDGLAVVVESDKATMEIPAGAAGVVAAVHVQEGDPVVEGTRLFTLNAIGAGSGPATPAPESERPEAGGASRAETVPDTGAGKADAGRGGTPSGCKQAVPAPRAGQTPRGRKSAKSRAPAPRSMRGPPPAAWRASWASRWPKSMEPAPGAGSSRTMSNSS